jgi:paraquat-inducible protein A
VIPEKNTAIKKGLIACRDCDLLHQVGFVPEGHYVKCSRCGSLLQERKKDSLNRSLALVMAALIFYIPANVYPIMTFEFMGQSQENTIWEGVKVLYASGMWPVATLVFCASITIPLLKLLGLLYLMVTLKWFPSKYAGKYDRTRLYRIISVIGRWSMLDVFLLSILVAVVKLGQMATVIPGPGALAFATVVVLTMFAADCFDPRLIWDNAEED